MEINSIWLNKSHNWLDCLHKCLFKGRSLQLSDLLDVFLVIQNIQQDNNIWFIFLNVFEICNFQNIHLVAHWLPSLDTFLEATAKDSHSNYRLFITGEPAPSPEQHVIPRGILENAIKMTNEPPTGLNASLHAALNNFSQVR